ncbi:MAG: hypothetical protein GF311_28615 [Candidatus Lokiarchaeota archaeon]|nr:hypothetical protein [Candidatus Lokiarchaeota archaeon]
MVPITREELQEEVRSAKDEMVGEIKSLRQTIGKENKPSLSRWLIGLLIGSTFVGGVLSSAAVYTWSKLFPLSPAEFRLVDFGSRSVKSPKNKIALSEYYELLLQNRGEQPGVVTAIEIDGNLFERFWTNREAGKKPRVLDPKAVQLAAWVKPREFVTFIVKSPVTEFTKIRVEHIVDGEPRWTPVERLPAPKRKKVKLLHPEILENPLVEEDHRKRDRKLRDLLKNSDGQPS